MNVVSAEDLVFNTHQVTVIVKEIPLIVKVYVAVIKYQMNVQSAVVTVFQKVIVTAQVVKKIASEYAQDKPLLMNVVSVEDQVSDMTKDNVIAQDKFTIVMVFAEQEFVRMSVESAEDQVSEKILTGVIVKVINQIVMESAEEELYQMNVMSARVPVLIGKLDTVIVKVKYLMHVVLAVVLYSTQMNAHNQDLLTLHQMLLLQELKMKLKMKLTKQQKLMTNYK